MSWRFMSRGLPSLMMLAVAAGAFAQPPPPQPPAPPPGPDLGKWWKDSQIAGALGLTEAQTKRIEDAFFEHRMKLIDLHAELERQEARLQPLLEADQPDEAKVGAQIDLVLAARGRLEKANAMMMLSIRKVLSTEQWRKLEAIKQDRERRHALPPPGQPARPGTPPQAPQPPPPRPEAAPHGSGAPDAPPPLPHEEPC